MENVILGTLLGDGSLIKDKTTYRLAIGHGEAQLPYLMWKASLIGAKRKPIKRISGYGFPGYELRYYNAPVLKRLAKVCLKNGVKKVTKEWIDKLDNLSLAIWYQDDGSWGRVGGRAVNSTRSSDRMQRQIVFSTHGFDVDSIRLLCDWLNDQGYGARICDRKNKYKVIVIKHKGTLKLWHTIAPYIFIKSKVDLTPRPCVIKCYCGTIIEPKLKVCQVCLWKAALDGKHKDENGRARLRRRFGTSSKNKLRLMKPTNPQINEYWVKPELVGAKIFAP